MQDKGISGQHFGNYLNIISIFCFRIGHATAQPNATSAKVNPMRIANQNQWRVLPTAVGRARQNGELKATFRDLDKWLRRRVRACYLKHWRKSKTRLKQLIKLGVSKRDALGAAKSGKGPWRLSRTLPVQRGLSIEFLAEQGLFNLEEYWGSLHQ